MYKSSGSVDMRSWPSDFSPHFVRVSLFGRGCVTNVSTVFNIVQTGEGCPEKNQIMSHARWFWQKADECARLARNASEPDRRDHYESHAEQWRLIAEQIDAGERRGFAPPPR